MPACVTVDEIDELILQRFEHAIARLQIAHAKATAD